MLVQLKNVLKNGIYYFTFEWEFGIYFFWVFISCAEVPENPWVFLLKLDFLAYLFPPPLTVCTTFGVSVPKTWLL